MSENVRGAQGMGEPQRNMPDTGVSRGGPPPPMAEYVVDFTVTYQLTMRAPADLSREDLYDMAEETYADGASKWMLDSHSIDSVEKA